MLPINNQISLSDFAFGSPEYYLAKCWQAGDKLVEAFDHQLRCCRGQPLSAAECVMLWRQFRRQVGLNGKLPVAAPGENKSLFERLSAALSRAKQPNQEPMMNGL